MKIICPVCYGRGRIMRLDYQDHTPFRFLLRCYLCKGGGAIEMPMGAQVKPKKSKGKVK